MAELIPHLIGRLSMSVNPSSRWYWNDWDNDLALRLCSFAAQGLWMRMLSIAARADGYVSIDGRPCSDADLAEITGKPTAEVAGLRAELEERRVFSRNRKGVIYSRRMIRDQKAQAACVTAGKAGGNPNFIRGTIPKEKRSRPFKRSDNPKKTKRIFAKDGGRCHWCGTELVFTNPELVPNLFHVDHVVAIRDGGDNDESNLVAACADCNHRRAHAGLAVGSPVGSPVGHPVGAKIGGVINHCFNGTNLPTITPTAKPLIPIPLLPIPKEEEDSEGVRTPSDAAAAPSTPEIDPIKALWDAGVELITNAGVSDKQARGMIGKWRREFGDAACTAAFAAAKNDLATEPISFIAACLQQSRNGRNGANGHGRRLTRTQEHSLAGLQAIWDADREEDLRNGISVTRSDSS